MKAPALWNRRAVAALALWPLSVLYYAGASVRRIVTNTWRADMAVICVGNVVAGGAGKTPVVIWLVQQLQARGYRPAVISRGYKGSYKGCVQVDPRVHVAAQVGDEPLLIARYAPCFVCRDRRESARAAIADGADCIIMDDGMQNPQLHKDMTLVVIDGQYGVGNGFMLPAGPCREPATLALRRAGAIICMGDAQHPAVKKLPADVMYRADMLPRTPAVSKKKVLAFAGIARPEKFFMTLEQLGADVVERIALGDHHLYERRELESMDRRAQALGAILVTTEKDWVRLDSTWQSRVQAVAVTLMVQQGDALVQQVVQHITNRRAA